ncbi:TPA: iron-containing alcohol dehydrogenase family protein [Streptococcus suis]|nr:iron-containing alcohol dehydrogenase family protein [Streptococcus suis]HEL1584598.1 iron-containing alcohol dehydrogenase family protein [Streptococcus suis]
MEFAKLVRGEPGQYVAAQGSLKELPERLRLFRQPVVITGQKSYAAFVKHFGKESDWPVLFYDGTASHEDMDRLAAQAKELGADVLIGIGGGKVMDTTKGTADRAGIEVVLVPTLAATCACSTPLLVSYYPDHRFKSVDYCQRSGFMTLVDYDLLIEAPKKYLISGISDTLAKWYELEAIHHGKNSAELPALIQLALATAGVSKNILLEDTEAALLAADQKKVTPAFQRMVDTIYAVAANVGCQTSDYVSGAHAIHNGLTALHETHSLVHGIKVAYGILVQLCVTGNEEEVKRLFPYYKKNNFLYSWNQLGITEDKEVAQLKVARYAASQEETFILLNPKLTPNDLLQAINRLDQLAAVFDKGDVHD